MGWFTHIVVVQNFKKFTDRFKGIHDGIYLTSTKENLKTTTCNRLDLENTWILTDFAQKYEQAEPLYPKCPWCYTHFALLTPFPNPLTPNRIKNLSTAPKLKLLGGMCESGNMFFVFLFFQLQESETFMPPAGCYAFPLNYFDVDGSSKYNHFPLLWCHKVLLFSDLGKQKEKEGRGNKYRGPRDWDGKWSQCQQVLDPYRFFKLGCHFNEKVPIVYGCLCFSIRVIRVCVSCTSLHT